MALDILVRNSGRDTRGHEVESAEKAALSIGAVTFLRASSFEWLEAIELMQVRNLPMVALLPWPSLTFCVVCGHRCHTVARRGRCDDDHPQE